MIILLSLTEIGFTSEKLIGAEFLFTLLWTTCENFPWREFQGYLRSNIMKKTFCRYLDFYGLYDKKLQTRLINKIICYQKTVSLWMKTLFYFICSTLCRPLKNIWSYFIQNKCLFCNFSFVIWLYGKKFESYNVEKNVLQN